MACLISSTILMISARMALAFHSSFWVFLGAEDIVALDLDVKPRPDGYRSSTGQKRPGMPEVTAC
jgi:hypothetical protein